MVKKVFIKNLLLVWRSTWTKLMIIYKLSIFLIIKKKTQELRHNVVTGSLTKSIGKRRVHKLLINLSTYLLLLLTIAPHFLSAQSSADLKAKREQLLEDIQANNRRLNTTRRNKAATVEQLAIIQSQIRNREELITTLQSEINLTDASIERSTEVVFALGEDIGRLKTEFTQLIRAAYRARLQNSWLTFLLSSRSFNEAFRRWQYLRQYQRFRSRQARLIIATQKTLESKLFTLESKRSKKNDLLINEQQQQQAIGREKNAQDNLLHRLKKSETGILAEIQRQEKARIQLNNAIEKAIATEMARVFREERLESNTSLASNIINSSVAVSGQFNQLKGRLPWPAKGKISSKFGRQPHPTVKGIEISNNGIDISLSSTSSVKSVANGIIASTHFVPGYQNMVLIRHGDYYTVYSNLESVIVSKGQKINAGQPLGKANPQSGDFHFEIWKQKERLNPESWIK